MINLKQYKNLIKVLGFAPKENASGIFFKKYIDSYAIELDFDNKLINYGEKIKSESKTTQNFSQAENWVVLECVDRILKKGYKPQNIILEKTWKSGHGTSGRLDICITHDDGTEYLLIECKTWGKEFEKELAQMNKTGGQLFTYFKFSNKADAIMLYASNFDNRSINYRNEIIKIEDDYRIGDVKDFYDKWNKLTNDNGIFDAWVNPYHFISKALTPKLLESIKQEDSGFIFNRFLEILRHNVVSDKPNAFNKIFTLFLCKIYDEKTTPENDELKFQWLEGKDDNISFQMRLADLYKNGMYEFLDKRVTDFSKSDFENKYKGLSDEVKDDLLKDITKLRLEKNNEFAIKEVFDTKSFKENAKVVKQVVELLQKFKLRYTKKQQYLSDFFELLLTTGLKQESGQFFTPVPIAQFIIKSIPLDQLIDEKLSKGERNNLLPYVIDYAAGSGHFLTEMMHETQRLLDKKEPSAYISDTAKKIKNWQEDHFDWALQYVYGIEKDYRLVKVGKVGCYLHGDGLANVIHSDGLGNFNKTDEYKDQLAKIDSNFPKENKQFDLVVSNPPYSVSAFKQNARSYYTEDDFELYEKLTDNSSEIECLFVERTKQLLKDGGMAGIILPSSILSNTGIYTKTREIILQYFDIIAIAELGSNTFMATGTNTVTLFLRRKNNYDSINLKSSINKFFTNLQDVTLNGVENPVAKYVAHTWEDISFEDYLTLLQKKPNKAIQQHEIYQEYKNKIKSKNNDEKWNKILELEQDKIFYYVLAYPQKLVLVNTGQKKEEKQFLGYEFSNRRGSEGIRPIQRGKNIDECTSLFDLDIFDNPEKASTYIYKAFKGDFDFSINEKLQKNICRTNLVDLMTFDRIDFEKNISLSVKKKVKIESRWRLAALSEISENLDNLRKPVTRGDRESGSYPYYGASGIVDYVSNYVIDDYVLLISEDGANLKSRVTPIAFTASGKIWVNNHAHVLKFPDIETHKFVELYLNRMDLSEFITGQAQPKLNQKNLHSIKIPLPPKDVQEKLVSEAEALEEKEKETTQKIEALKLEIANLMDSSSNIKSNTKLENIALLLKRGKSAKYGNSQTQIIKSGQARGFKEFDFSQKHFVVDGFILDERKLERGDILINSSGVGTAGRVTLFNLEGDFVVDSHITILRADKTKALPAFVLYSLAQIGFKNIEAMAMGQSGQIELTIKTIQNIKIPLPSLSVQKKIVSGIEKIESKIIELEKEIAAISDQRDSILKKYLE